jgi:hypothetical protein
VKPPARRRASAALRAAAAFLAAIAFWLAFSAPYERFLASAGETLLRASERPPVTRLEAGDGEILVARSDFPPSSDRPGIPASGLHFNLALLAALFALDPRPWEGRRVAALLAGAAVLSAVHLAALVFQVRSFYATGLGPWSAAHYGPVARNFWSGGFHFYEVAGRFAAPFAIWWLLRRDDGTGATPSARGRRRRKKGKD